MQVDRPSSAEWIAEAEHFERIAEKLNANPELKDGFKQLAAEARQKADAHHTS